jgi:acetoin utilization deacetylase AcuC-like enzyme
MDLKEAVLWSSRYGVDIGHHVFPTAKYEAVVDALIAAGYLHDREGLEPPRPTRALLKLAHTPEYLDDFEALRWTPRTQFSELPLTHAIVDSFETAASGTAEAVRRAVRLGAAAHVGGGLHHAFADKAEGFCYINDLAVGAEVALREWSATRIAIVDLDLHQGNGTAGIFAGRPEVFTLSLHQEDNYPMPKERSTLDVGLPDGTDDAAFARALAPALDRVWAFAPDLVLYQAGADPFHDDQLGGLALSFEGLEARDRAVLDGCEARGIPVVSTLGGGYAHHFEDTVRIHTTTMRLTLDIVRRKQGR